MTKECNVIINNDAVTVILFDDIEVQFPSIHAKAKKVFVKYEDGKYSIVDKLSDDNTITKKKNKKAIINTDEIKAEVLVDSVNE